MSNHKLTTTIISDEVKKERKMKYLRIDNKTIIVVPEEQSSEEAINEFKLKQLNNSRKLDNIKEGLRWQQ